MNRKSRDFLVVFERAEDLLKENALHRQETVFVYTALQYPTFRLLKRSLLRGKSYYAKMDR